MKKHRFLAIRDTEDVEKNISNQISDYVWNIREKDNRKEIFTPYSFVSRPRKFALIPGTNSTDTPTDSLYITPPLVDISLSNPNDLFFKIETQKILDCLDLGSESLFIVSPNPNNKTSDKELYKNLCIVSLDSKRRKFLHFQTKKPICQNEMRIALFAGIFKLGKLPIYILLVNSEFVEIRTFDEFSGKNLSYISVLKESRSLKDEIFSPAYTKGFVTQVGRHELFVHGDEFQFEIFGDYLAQIPSISKYIHEYSLIHHFKEGLIDLREHIHVYSNWPSSIDEKGIVCVDLRNIEINQSGFLKIEIEAGEFLKYWVYKTHRSIYEFVLHKTYPLQNPSQQGSIQSPGFY